MASPALRPKSILPDGPLQRIERLQQEYSRELSLDLVPAKRPPKTNVDRSLSHHMLLALGIVLVLVVGIGGWAGFTNIAGAVVANGVLVVDGGSQKVQHPEGGTVSAIFVDNEDHVTAGQVLLRLDGTTTTANLAIIEGQLREGYSQIARLTAEASGAATAMAPSGAGDLAIGPEFAALLASQQQLLDARAAARTQQVARLHEQIDQFNGQAIAIAAQRRAAQQSLDILVKEDTDLTALFAQGLVGTDRLNSIRRDRAGLEGEVGRLDGNAAEIAASIAERNVQIGQIEIEFRAQVMTESQTIRQQIAQQQQQRIAAEDRLSHLDIRAPQTGTIHESIVHTVGGVVGPGDILMLVVPEATSILVDTRISQVDIDKVMTGQDVILRFPSLDQRTTPELKGRVQSISPDLIRDSVTGVPYYSMRVAALDGERSKLPEGTRLIPGMPVEAFAQTGDRSVLSYLLHPVTEQLSRMFIEK